MGYATRCWRHVICNAKNTWLPADERGFRDHDHRIHSSGDYRNPPPPAEHEGLRRYNQQRAGAPVAFLSSARQEMLRAFVLKMRSMEHPIIAAALTSTHLHALAELPDDREIIFRDIGRCKQKASHAVRRLLPGQIWSEGGEYKRIRDRRHYDNVWKYVRQKQERDALIWSVVPEENWIDNDSVECGRIIPHAPAPALYRS
jgi:REP element-mobilizing transposase RayT